MALSLLSNMMNVQPCLAWMPSGAEWLVIIAFGLLLFGKRLPEVGRSLGKGIVEFKKGLKGVEEEIEDASNKSNTTTASKFDPYTGQPTASLPPGAKFDPMTGKPLDAAVEQPATTTTVTATTATESPKVG